MDLNTSFQSVEGDEETLKVIRKVEKLKQQKQEKVNIQKEENYKLINTVLKYVKVDQNRSYLCDLNSLDYSKLSEELDGMPKEECRNKLKTLLRPITKEKSLHQVLIDSYYNLSKVHVGKPKGYNVFLIANMEAIKEVLKRRKSKMGVLNSVASAMWNKLTEKEKLTYEGIKASGKTPLDLYYESVREKDDSVTLNQAKGVWNSLPMSEKENFIKESAKMKMLTENTQKDVETENFDTFLGPSKKELSEYLAVHGMPEKPSQSLQLSYLTKCGEYDNKLRIGELTKRANQKFNELTSAEQTYWSRKHEKSFEKYEKRFKQWEDKLDEVEKFMLKLLLEFGIDKRSSKNPKLKSMEEFHSVVMPNIGMKFEITPSDVPKFKIVDVYKQNVEKKTFKKIKYHNAQKIVTRLDKIKKTALQAKGEKIKVKFINKLMSYVKSLTEHDRSIYLGQHRFRFMKALEEDIFENDFPDSKYPIFISKQPNCKVEKKLKNKEKKLKNEMVSSEKKPVTNVKKANRFNKNLYKKIESSLSEIFDDISVADLSTKKHIKEKKKESKLNDKNEKVDKNNNSSEKSKGRSSIKLKVEKENSMETSHENLKRKRSDSWSENKDKCRKLNDDEGNSMVKFELDSDDAEEDDVNFGNISEYLNSIEFENVGMEFDDIKKEEHDIEPFDY